MFYGRSLMAVVIVAGAAALLGGCTDPNTICNGKSIAQWKATPGYNVIVGTDNADNLNGTAGRDVIFGLAGNDVIHGNDGADVICGGTGDDTISGGKGADVLIGGQGFNTVTYAGGSDRVYIHYFAHTDAHNVTTGSGTGQMPLDSGPIDTLTNFSKFVGTPYDDSISMRDQVSQVIDLDGHPTGLRDQLFVDDGLDQVSF